MYFDVTSARDPVFYKWHGHLEEELQKFRDAKLSKYVLEDFSLQNDVEVESIKTVMDKGQLSTNEDIENVLVTVNEESTVRHHEGNEIQYTRINHLEFKYQLKIKNPQKITKKVILRIWLGPVTNER